MQSFKSIKILYIEDEEFIRKNGVEYLEFYSDYVYEATDGIDGYQQYEALKPDIIICDIIMPKMNGLELIEKIRKTDKTTKIIVLTARVDTHFLLKAVELGLVKYITKPITESKLLDALQSSVKLINASNENLVKMPNSFVFDILNKTLFQKKSVVKLTKKELLFLELCIKNGSRVTTYEELEDYVWQGYMTEEALRSIVKSLRSKLGKENLKNISGIGYKLAQI